jgi:hypothetical protein
MSRVRSLASPLARWLYSQKTRHVTVNQSAHWRADCRLASSYNIRPIVACAYCGVFIQPLPSNILSKSITILNENKLRVSKDLKTYIYFIANWNKRNEHIRKYQLWWKKWLNKINSYNYSYISERCRCRLYLTMRILNNFMTAAGINITL